MCRVHEVYALCAMYHVPPSNWTIQITWLHECVARVHEVYALCAMYHVPPSDWTIQITSPHYLVKALDNQVYALCGTPYVLRVHSIVQTSWQDHLNSVIFSLGILALHIHVLALHVYACHVLGVFCRYSCDAAAYLQNTPIVPTVRTYKIHLV